MNTKTKYMIPAFAAVFALMFVVATPYVIAEMDATGSHMGKYNIQEKLDAYCAMSPEEQEEVITKHNKSEDKVAKMNEYCSLDEEGRAALIESYKAEYQHYDKKKHGDMIEMINAYCVMSPEEQAEVIAKHNKSDEMVSKINEYCLLDEEGQKAMIAEHKEKFKKHTDVTKHGMTGMSGEYDASKHAGMTGMSGEYDASKHAEFVEKIQELKQAHANGDFDKVKELSAELQDLRNQIVEEIRH
ncbi:MAG: hypothetical protein QQN51_00950 [Nitrosopumilus sp.]